MNKPSNVVLLIDDEPKIRRFLRAGFELHGGFSVQEAESAEEGLKATTFNAPDIIILDLNLPDLHGTEVLEQIRSWSNVPVIILSVEFKAAVEGRLPRGIHLVGPRWRTNSWRVMDVPTGRVEGERCSKLWEHAPAIYNP
jgi:CheY-like chemotaxis protein